MRKSLLWITLAAALAAGCAKPVQVGLNDANKEFLEAWMSIHYPNVQPTADGIYIVEDRSGTGIALGNPETLPYLFVEYTTRSLDGTVTNTTSRALSQQIGTYEYNNFYGPEVWRRPDYGVMVGVEKTLSTMKVGGKRTAVIPGWLLSGKVFGDPDYCFKKASGTNAIYEIEVVNGLNDIVKWEVDSLCRYLADKYPSVAAGDSLKFGYYYVRSKEPEKESVSFAKDTTIRINYIGRLLNGTVFDTTIKDTAKFYGIYSAGKTYGPVSMNMKENYAESTFSSGGSKAIDGFSYTLSVMHPGEAGTALFYSALGYADSGSGQTIPGYSPLRFDIEIVE